MNLLEGLALWLLFLSLLYLSQDVKLFIIMFVMNVFREGQETIIDPLYPLVNAPVTPTIDLVMHIIIIVAIEIGALAQLFKIYKSQEINLVILIGPINISKYLRIFQILNKELCQNTNISN